MVTDHVIIFTNPYAQEGYDTRSIFKRSLTGLNSKFSFSWTSYFIKAEELSLHYNLLRAEGRIIGFIPFPRVLALCEMQSVSSTIWTRVAVSISYDDNHYTMGISSDHVIGRRETEKQSHLEIGDWPGDERVTPLHKKSIVHFL